MEKLEEICLSKNKGLVYLHASKSVEELDILFSNYMDNDNYILYLSLMDVKKDVKEHIEKNREKYNVYGNNILYYKNRFVNVTTKKKENMYYK